MDLHYPVAPGFPPAEAGSIGAIQRGGPVIEDPHARRGPRDEEDEGERTDEELEETFPSSDPPGEGGPGI